MRQSRLTTSMLVNTAADTYMEDAAMQAPPFRVTGSCIGAGKPPRQMVSDMKWEGDTWISPETLARNVAKRSRRRKEGGGDGGDDDVGKCTVLGPTTEDAAYDGSGSAAAVLARPLKPADPVDVPNDKIPMRRRDKDRIPSRQTWQWFDVSASWVLVDRPRVFEAGAFFSYASIPPKQEDLLRLMLDDTTTSLDEKFLRDDLVPRLNRTHPVSLRLLDWLVVDYAREKDIAYRRYVPTLRREMIVVMHALYTSWLHRWRRRHYDPFRRRHRIYFVLDGEMYSTTVAQLHFFYMARLFGFLDYAADHLNEILPHMKTTLAGTNEAKNGARRRGEEYRRRPLVSKARPKAFMSKGTFELCFAIEGDVEDDCDGDDAKVQESDDDDEEANEDGNEPKCVQIALTCKAAVKAAETGLRMSMSCLFTD